MCWSGEASFFLAICGFVGAAIAAYKREPLFRYLPLVYFSGMETLQGFTYSYIDQCSNIHNQNLTLLSYLHIAFQPFFVNMFGLSFMSSREQRKAWWIWPACAVASLIMVSMYVFPEFPAACNATYQSLCGPVTCSYHGNWHIAWMLQLSNLDPHWVSYWTVAFILPLVYGGWRFVGYHLFLGPLLAAMLTNDQNEHPAIWCLLSIAFLLAVHIPWIKHKMLSKNAKIEYDAKRNAAENKGNKE